MASYREEGETPGEQALWRGDRGKDITPDGCGLFGHAKPRDRAERGRGPCPGRDDCAISHIQPFRLAMPGPAGASNRAMFRGRTRSARLLKPCHVANWGGRDRRNRRTGAARSPAGARTRVCLFRWSEGGRRNGPLAAKRRSARPNPKPRKKTGSKTIESKVLESAQVSIRRAWVKRRVGNGLTIVQGGPFVWRFGLRGGWCGAGR